MTTITQHIRWLPLHSAVPADGQPVAFLGPGGNAIRGHYSHGRFLPDAESPHNGHLTPGELAAAVAKGFQPSFWRPV